MSNFILILIFFLQCSVAQAAPKNNKKNYIKSNQTIRSDDDAEKDKILAQQKAESEAKNLKILSDIEQRMQELEQQQRYLQKKYSEFVLGSRGRVTPFLGEKIALGGYFESGLTAIYGPNTQSQTSANSQTLGINVAAEFSEKVRFVSQFITFLGFNLQNPNNNSNLNPPRREWGGVALGSLVAQGYVEFAQNEKFNIQTGVGYAPFGQSFQLREPVLFRRRTGPQMINSTDTDSVGIANPLWSGVHISGLNIMPFGRTGYDVYTFTPFSNAKSLGLGGRLWWANDENLTLGFSNQAGEQKNASYFSFGFDMNLQLKEFGLITEYGQNRISGDDRSDAESYYIEPYYRLFDGEFVIYTAADYISLPGHVATTSTGTIADGYKKWEFGGGVNWLPLPTVRFRLGYLKHDYIGTYDTVDGQRKDFDSFDLSTAIAF